MTPTHEEIAAAAAQLATSARGLKAMHGLYGWIEAFGTGLDGNSQRAVLTLLQGAWGPLAGTTRELIAAELGVE